MLLSLRIENFALIDHLDLDLGTGLNVFTGETGAGKSIILDAVDAVLGGKVDRRSIRTGATRSLVEATFEIEKKWLNWLTEQEIDLVDGSLIVCSREVVISGDKLRSRSRVNGVLVNRKLIDQLRDRLIEITAQGQTLQLGQPELQQEWLDLYGGQALIKARKEVSVAYTQAQTCSHALEKRRQFEQQRLQRLDLLTYQIRELDAATLTTPDELEQLQIEHQRLNHIVELQQQSYQIYQALYQNESGLAAADLLSQAEGKLTDLVEYDSQLQPILEIVSEAVAQITEAGRQIGSYGEQLESDPQRLEEVEDRIRDLKQICRKYGQNLGDVIEYYERIQTELKDLEDEDQSIEALEEAYQHTLQTLKETCQQLTSLRQKAAHQLETHLIKELKPLAMKMVKFQVELHPISPTALGADQIQFCFSPNPGEPLQPLGAIASGGEMSRFLLALKACFSQIAGSGTLIFDEIDVGVSGRVATAIAQKLHQLSQRHQVLCVTHQPLVAAMGDHHFRVTKETIQTDCDLNSEGTDPETRTVVRVTPLTSPQRREELAQLASGESAQEAIAFAESLLSQAALMKK
ncbi:DNA repair protein RecN [Planktothrix tepida]|uniref:DNA repair protein RecN n=1 Tax=Planktothrix tepida PCC 9214 TaxID=671072 RepID=A0A1J1LMM5_9CYAN|nr:DNA repair protein RecN [Planktothrix tepida]CAD5981434.1 DNA repair protein RecN [Planktothrix tepida]CUR33792.1 DNA repair protein RecN [Planktothrix tepida PCC 9214]